MTFAEELNGVRFVNENVINLEDWLDADCGLRTCVNPPEFSRMYVSLPRKCEFHGFY